MTAPTPDDGPPSPPVTLRPEALPPEVAALVARLDEARNDHERIALLAEHEVEQLRLFIEARAEAKADRIEILRRLTAQGLLLQGVGDRLVDVVQRLGGVESGVGAISEQLGGIARELGFRAKQDSIHDDKIERVEKKTTFLDRRIGLLGVLFALGGALVDFLYRVFSRPLCKLKFSAPTPTPSTR